MTLPKETPVFEQFQAGIARLSADDRARMRRELTGEASLESIKRGDVYSVIRDLRLSTASLRSEAYQEALRDIQRAVSQIAALNEGEG